MDQPRAVRRCAIQASDTAPGLPPPPGARLHSYRGRDQIVSAGLAPLQVQHSHVVNSLKETGIAQFNKNSPLCRIVGCVTLEPMNSLSETINNGQYQRSIPIISAVSK